MITQRELDIMQVEAEITAEQLFVEFQEAYLGNRMPMPQVQEVEENGQRDLYSQARG